MLEEIQREVDTVIAQLGGYWSPLAMLAAHMEEIGELARDITAREGIKPKKPGESTTAVGEEIADAIFSLVCLANYYGVDLNREIRQCLIKYRTRDALRFTGSSDPPV